MTSEERTEAEPFTDADVDLAAEALYADIISRLERTDSLPWDKIIVGHVYRADARAILTALVREGRLLPPGVVLTRTTRARPC